MDFEFKGNPIVNCCNILTSMIFHNQNVQMETIIPRYTRHRVILTDISNVVYEDLLNTI